MKDERTAAQQQEEERIKLNAERGEPMLFLPDGPAGEAARGFGIGYWLVGDCIHAVRRMANGYERYPCMILNVELLRQLVAAADKEN